jgi:30S ribosomal protein S31
MPANRQAATLQELSMGQGDRKSRKGKIWRGSYGNTRSHKPSPAKHEAPAAKAGAKKK